MEIDTENTQKEADDLSLIASRKKDFDLLDVSNGKRFNDSNMKKEIESIIKKMEELKETMKNLYRFSEYIAIL